MLHKSINRHWEGDTQESISNQDIYLQLFYYRSNKQAIIWHCICTIVAVVIKFKAQSIPMAISIT